MNPHSCICTQPARQSGLEPAQGGLEATVRDTSCSCRPLSPGHCTGGGEDIACGKGVRPQHSAPRASHMIRCSACRLSQRLLSWNADLPPAAVTEWEAPGIFRQHPGQKRPSPSSPCATRSAPGAAGGPGRGQDAHQQSADGGSRSREHTSLGSDSGLSHLSKMQTSLPTCQVRLRGSQNSKCRWPLRCSF